MAEINAVPWNGLKVCSTFSGGGGSSTGYRWAGCKVVWANEFERNPQLTYRANHPHTILNPRDIKTVTAKEILFVTRMNQGDLDIFDGSPPCQGFSIDNQNRLQNKAKVYDNGISQTNEGMFFEYVRLLKGLQPKVFVAENVKGLTMGKAKSILGSFEMDLFNDQSNTIVHALMDCGYVVRWQILNAADYGTPQSRQRVFFIGVRKDLEMTPTFPAKQGFQYSVLDALPHLAGNDVCWSYLDGQGTSPNLNKDNPAPCVTRRGYKDAGGKTAVKVRHISHGNEVWKSGDKPSPSIVASNANRKTSATQSSGGWIKITAGLAGDHRRRESGYDLENPIATIKKGGGTHGHQFFVGYGMDYAQSKDNSFPRNLKRSADEPIETIQKMHGVCGGAPVTLVNGEGKRKFTMAELRRLGGFPDDYVLAGSYSNQWAIIGNSVCPPQMRALASHIYETIFK